MRIKIRNARIVNSRKMYITEGDILVKGYKIEKIGTQLTEKADKEINADGMYLIPGFIDAHVHIESSLLTPTEYSKVVLKHGTTTVIADCHEICNVMGIKGQELFLRETSRLPLEVFFAIPSCVPASHLGTSGARISVADIKKTMKNRRIVALGEVMDFPAVLARKKNIMAKIKACRGKVINGHAPGLRGKLMKRYFDAGIMDDHESLNYEEMAEKADYGVMIFLREGSAEVCEEENYRLLESHPDKVCFCSDDKTAGDLDRYGSILFNVNKAIGLGYDPLRVIRCATYNCARHYRMEKIRSNIEPGLKADFFLSRSLKKIKPEMVFVNGEIVSSKGRVKRIPKFRYPDYAKLTIKRRPIKKSELKLSERSKGNIIMAKDGSLLTGWMRSETKDEYDPAKDILKIVVIERYRRDGNISVGQITGFGIKEGAIGTTVAHDCHNIMAVGTSDDSIAKVVNRLIKLGGGFAAYSRRDGMKSLPLPVAGLLSQKGHRNLTTASERLRTIVKRMGCKMRKPFSTLSFMALEVIPELKITDKGLVDVKRFRII